MKISADLGGCSPPRPKAKEAGSAKLAIIVAYSTNDKIVSLKRSQRIETRLN